jgi:sugar O-acyltransferase (sialic acid O-acetyltransferase NeuD family)
VAIKEIVIVGDSAFAEIAYEYFTYDSPFEVVAFAVEGAYLTKQFLFELPVYPLEDLGNYIDLKSTGFHCAVVYTQLNRLRARLINFAKNIGLTPVSYVSSKSFVWRNAKIGEHVFIFEDNTIQPFVEVGNNVVMWSGNHIGHHSKIEDNVFIASHVVLSGFTSVGESSFIGVNATISNNVKIAKNNWIGLGATITHDTQPNQLYKGGRSEPAAVSSISFFRVDS